MFDIFIDTINDLIAESGLAALEWQNIVMILISFLFMFLAIKHKFEPLLLLPIAFGMLLTNLPNSGMYHPELWNIDAGNEIDFGRILHEGGLLDFLYIGVKLQIYPALIFLGIGCMTDFAPLIANPKSFLLGAAAQAGIFLTFIGAAVLGFNSNEAGAISIIGGADGPTAIYVSSKLLNGGGYKVEVGTIALAAYTYMALVPLIQPPIMRALTTKKERMVRMTQLRTVSQTEKIIFPIAV
ncbi:MAG: sodium ion-translocating decarboxylase subunit beta, partial [Oscillospiraceae bacterium]|nr:sodium ion-translocating decarboxylase subunit beta [Oscillospiraceae bacterium]